MTRRVGERVGHVPESVTSLVGRRSEVADIRQLMGKSRMVTLTGPGGVGKTRLALEVARRAGAAFGDGVWFIPLAEVTRTDLVVPSIMSAIAPGGGMRRELAERIGNEHLLLVLDNCEHLTEACADVASDLLSECPGLSVLATSRESLRIEGEVLFAVRPLSVPRPGEEGAQGVARHSDAVKLFIERALLVNPDLSVDAEAERSIIDLCQRLDGLPLAIELAAAATRVLPIGAVSVQAGRPLTPLAHGLRNAPPRQQSLRATIACSHDLCSPSAQMLWSCMSVLRGGTSIEAVQKVCAVEPLSPDDVVSALVELTEKSVVEFDGAHYRMLETIRYFGAERLEASGREAGMRAAHLDYVASIAEQFEEGWYTGDQRELVRGIQEQRANVRAALDLCLVDRERAGTGLRIARQLYGFWLTVGPMREGREWLDRFLDAADEPSTDRASALWIAGLLTTLDGDVDAAERLIEEGVALSRRLNDRANLAHGLQGLGFCHVLRGQIDDALAVLGEAVDLERSLGAPNPHLGRALTTLGIALCAGDQAGRAAEVLEEAKAAQAATGDDFMGSWSEAFLGLAACLDRRLQRAEELLSEVLERKHSLGDTLGVSLVLEFLAWVALENNDHQRGARLLCASEVVGELVGPHLVGFIRLGEWHADYHERARQGAGDRDQAAAVRWARATSLVDIVAYAMKRKDPNLRPEVPLPYGAPLTPRERQIALLVAEGKTNKEIAAELVVAPRTVDSHVQNILTKLDFSSRAQIAALVAKG